MKKKFAKVAGILFIGHFVLEGVALLAIAAWAWF